MSGGKDCREVLEKLYLFLDHEIDDATCSEIQQHLDECRPCLDAYQLDRIVKERVARSCCEQAPKLLHDRVLMSIRQVQVEYTHDFRREG